MPTYLCHGFRWHRNSVRIYTAVKDVDGAAPDWVVAPGSEAAIVSSLRAVFDFLPPDPHSPSPPSPQSGLPLSARERVGEGKEEGEGAVEPRSRPGEISLVEEYDPADLSGASRPYVYVADYVVRVGLSVGVAEEMAAYEEGMKGVGGGENEGKGWFEKLRDGLQVGEEIRWYVVVCGDEVRATGMEDTEGEGESGDERMIEEGDPEGGVQGH